MSSNLRPANLNTAEYRRNDAERLALNTPWRLEEEDFWLLYTRSLREAIRVMEWHCSDHEMSVREAWVVAKCRWHLARIEEDLRAQALLNEMRLSQLAEQGRRVLQGGGQGRGAVLAARGRGRG